MNALTRYMTDDSEITIVPPKDSVKLIADILGKFTTFAPFNHFPIPSLNEIWTLSCIPRKDSFKYQLMEMS